MGTIQVYFDPKLYERLAKAAQKFSLSKRDFVRAVIAAALNELESEQDQEDNNAG